MPYLQLTSSDSELFQIEQNISERSVLLNNMIEDLGDEARNILREIRA